MSRRLRERGDKRERWDFQPDWREERDQDDDELPEREDDPGEYHPLAALSGFFIGEARWTFSDCAT